MIMTFKFEESNLTSSLPFLSKHAYFTNASFHNYNEVIIAGKLFNGPAVCFEMLLVLS